MTRVIALVLFLAAHESRGQENGGEYYYDEGGGAVETEISPEEKRVIAEVEALYAELSAIRERGNLPDELAQHRSYRLVPMIREVAKKADGMGSTVLLGKAVELASCESEPGRSYEWVDVFSKVANKFDENDFEAAIGSLPDANKRSFKEAMMANLPGSFRWKVPLEKLATWEDGGGEWIEQEQQP